MNNDTTVKEAQAELNACYMNGSLGVLVSGSLWLLVAWVAGQIAPRQAIWVLLVGGAWIHPVSILLSRLSGIKGKQPVGNPLAKLAMESTLFMIFCIPLAYGLSLLHIEWFFLGMMAIIGGRYLTFTTLYGRKMYWLLGFALGVSACLLYKSRASVAVITTTAGIIETCFGFILLFHYKKSIG